MNRLALASSLLAVTALGCGSSPGDSPPPAGARTKALAEIAETNAGLEQTLGAYGDRRYAQAERLAGDTYLEHFEHVEGPLGQQDADLETELEHLLRDDLRAAIRAHRDGRVAALGNQIQDRLDQAGEALR